MLSCFVTLAVLVPILASPLTEPNNAFLHLPVRRRVETKKFASHKRSASDLELSLTIDNTFYTLDIEIGTPPQPVTLRLGTDSSDTYVLDNTACRDPRNCSRELLTGHDTWCLQNVTCSHESIFDYNASSSFRLNHTTFYRPHTHSPFLPLGEWAQDTLRLGGHNISNFNFAVADYVGRFSAGVAGVGLAAGESPVTVGDASVPYANLPQQLKQQGAIQHVAYSLWLNHGDTGEGSVLFGAIDHAKFTSDLYTMPLVQTDTDDGVSRLAVPMTGLSIYDADGTEQAFVSCDISVVLDSSSTFSALPYDFVRPFFKFLDSIEYDSHTYLVPCSTLSSKDGGLGIHLGGIDITVGFSDLFVKVFPTDAEDTEYCVPGFTVNDMTESKAVIGENILRTLYVVYDLENLEVGIAAAQTGAAASNSSIEVLSTGIPGTRANKSLKTIVDDEWEYAVTQITLSKPLVTRGPDVANMTVSFEPEAVTRSRKVPSSVTHMVAIGAKANSPSTKASKDGACVKRGSLFAVIAGLLFSVL